MMKTLLGFATMLCLLLSQAALAEFPSWYPKDGFSHYGKIDEVNAAGKSVIIDDREYHYFDNTIVHSLSAKSDSLARLRKGVMVGFTFDIDAKGSKRVGEIWLLPDTYTQPND